MLKSPGGAGRTSTFSGGVVPRKLPLERFRRSHPGVWVSEWPGDSLWNQVHPVSIVPSKSSRKGDGAGWAARRGRGAPAQRRGPRRLEDDPRGRGGGAGSRARQHGRQQEDEGGK